LSIGLVPGVSQERLCHIHGDVNRRLWRNQQQRLEGRRS
jgi:hypothetical protein